MNDFTMKIMDISPELAKEMKKNNKANRYLNFQKAKVYAKDMKEGLWQLSPEGISFDKDGNLVNGQHRLEAIIISGETVRMAVFFGVETKIFDRGRSRTAADTLAMSGLPESISNSRITGAINLLVTETLGSNRYKISDSEMQIFAECNAEILQVVRAIARTGSTHQKSLTDNATCCAAVFCALFNGISESMLSRFFEIVNTGFYSFREETAAISLRNYLLQNKNYSHSIQMSHDIFAQVLCAINGFVSRKPRMKSYPSTDVPVYFQNVKQYIEKFFFS